jgi:hypothetical protein
MHVMTRPGSTNIMTVPEEIWTLLNIQGLHLILQNVSLTEILSQ